LIGVKARVRALRLHASMPEPVTTAARHLTLDVRGMEPPEPLERVLEAIDGFRVGDTLKLVIDCEPRPLFRILAGNGYAWRSEPGAASLYEITIWRR